MTIMKNFTKFIKENHELDPYGEEDWLDENEIIGYFISPTRNSHLAKNFFLHKFPHIYTNDIEAIRKMAENVMKNKDYNYYVFKLYKNFDIDLLG